MFVATPAVVVARMHVHVQSGWCILVDVYADGREGCLTQI